MAVTAEPAPVAAEPSGWAAGRELAPSVAVLPAFIAGRATASSTGAEFIRATATIAIRSAATAITTATDIRTTGATTCGRTTAHAGDCGGRRTTAGCVRTFA